MSGVVCIGQKNLTTNLTFGWRSLMSLSVIEKRQGEMHYIDNGFKGTRSTDNKTNISNSKDEKLLCLSMYS